MAKANIYIVEDDKAIRRELVLMLEREGYACEWSLAFNDVATAVKAAAPDLVLLDLTLPDTDGQFVCREVRRCSDVPIIVITARATEVDEVMAMEMGADDFVTKPYSSRVLLAHIESVLRRARGSAQGSVDMLEHGGLSLDLSRSVVSFEGGAPVELTKNETRILSALMRAGGAIVSRAALMRELWESDAFVDDNTLTVNINRLRGELARAGADGILVTHRGQGYALK